MEMDGSFSKLTADEREALLGAGERQNYAKGDLVLGQGGDREETIYVVSEGAVRIERQLRVRASYRLDEQGRPVRSQPDDDDDDRPTRIVLQHLGKGSIFGEMSFLVMAKGTTDIVADEDSEIIHIPRSAVSRLMDQDAGFTGRFYHSLAVTLTRRIRQTNKLVV